MFNWDKLTPAERLRVLRRERQEDRADQQPGDLDTKPREDYVRYRREFPRSDPRD